LTPDEAADYILGHTQGAGADVVIECTGVPRLLQTAVDLARTGGLVQLLSFLSEPATINAARWLAKQVTVVASNAFTHDDFRRSMTFLADGRVQAQPLHSRTVRLDELEATLRGLSAGPSDDIKILVDPRPS
jgi:(R,R)-butanediol dehydrogenase / meso-butanediol dehydrogenase / diacetyl reductase